MLTDNLIGSALLMSERANECTHQTPKSQATEPELSIYFARGACGDRHMIFRLEGLDLEFFFIHFEEKKTPNDSILSVVVQK